MVSIQRMRFHYIINLLLMTTKNAKNKQNQKLIRCRMVLIAPYLLCISHSKTNDYFFTLFTPKEQYLISSAGISIITQIKNNFYSIVESIIIREKCSMAFSQNKFSILFLIPFKLRNPFRYTFIRGVKFIYLIISSIWSQNIYIFK